MPEITQLPKMDHTFTISVKGKESQQVYEGTFTYVRPNLGKKVEISKMEAKLREDLFTLPTDVNAFVEIIAKLRFTLQDTKESPLPTWWKNSNYGLNLYDLNVVVAIDNEVEKFEKEWDEKVYGKKEEPVKSA